MEEKDDSTVYTDCIASRGETERNGSYARLVIYIRMISKKSAIPYVFRKKMPNHKLLLNCLSIFKTKRMARPMMRLGVISSYIK
ncbi:RidA family protein [Paenibacillus gallinarum]|uniref:Uncharacterized protein n=1 Tax=Paenibacillus gallinarum TaxID=2762232 RepID=A0ABR8T404_9BACL|nr:hypothetical protein [Paenibacillus gallinarum]MBD7970437.1 hypothetical protein [Paenibacillus gallinarum]